MATRLDLTSGRLVNDAFLVPKPAGNDTFVAWDSDVKTYLSAVAAADGQGLEPAVAIAIEAFITGLKADGAWSAISASCLLCGARTLAGALVPLKGAAPTNNGFVSGDYNRETGIIGDGTSKYLDTNRADNADGQNSCHVAVWQSAAATSASSTYATSIGAITTTGGTSATDIAEGFGAFSAQKYYRCRDLSGATDKATTNSNNFQGVTRGSGTSQTYRVNGENTPRTVSSVATAGLSTFAVFAQNTEGVIDNYSNARLAFYSVGADISLSALNSRLTTCINAIAAAIP